ncbi:MAG: prepilin-type N-terminal cleavage/methylation domain-containing protein [Patescibacteria group bacterium]
MSQKYSRRGGFTLIELLIVIAIIAILAGVVFVALDPLTRFRDARDSRRFADVSAVLSAIRVAQVDKGGRYTYGVRALASVATGTPYMITNGTTSPSTLCNATCKGVVMNLSKCADISQLQSRGYLGAVPLSPNGEGSWSSNASGYYLQLNANNSVTVGACEAENQTSISITR